MALTQVPIELSSTPGIVDNSNATAITIDSSENVGIGTSSASANLHIYKNTTANEVLRIEQGTTAYGAQALFKNPHNSSFYFGLAGDSTGDTIHYNGANSNSLFYTNGSERLRIKANGEVEISGIGNTTGARLNIGSDANNAFVRSYDTSQGMLIGVANAQPFKVMTNSLERMRIDSSGNLLVGKTVNNTFSEGLVAKAAGGANITSNGDTALDLNRRTSDGTVLNFRKDNTTVGSIGTVAGRFFIGNDDTFLTFKGSTDTVYPASSSGGGRDNAIDLGESGTRFKDIYLSGGVNFSANVNASGMTSETLDDYEEGAWTPILRGDNATVSGQSYGAVTGHYVKVGQLVYAAFDFALTAAGTTNGGYAVIGNLPYDALSSNLGGGSMGYYTGLSNTTGPLVFYVAGNQAYLMEGSNTYVARTDITNTTRLIGFVSYRTSA